MHAGLFIMSRLWDDSEVHVSKISLKKQAVCYTADTNKYEQKVTVWQPLV